METFNAFRAKSKAKLAACEGELLRVYAFARSTGAILATVERGGYPVTSHGSGGNGMGRAVVPSVDPRHRPREPCLLDEQVLPLAPASVAAVGGLDGGTAPASANDAAAAARVAAAKAAALAAEQAAGSCALPLHLPVVRAVLRRRAAERRRSAGLSDSALAQGIDLDALLGQGRGAAAGGGGAGAAAGGAAWVPAAQQRLAMAEVAAGSLLNHDEAIMRGGAGVALRPSSRGQQQQAGHPQIGAGHDGRPKKEGLAATAAAARRPAFARGGSSVGSRSSGRFDDDYDAGGGGDGGDGDDSSDDEGGGGGGSGGPSPPPPSSQSHRHKGGGGGGSGRGGGGGPANQLAAELAECGADEVAARFRPAVVEALDADGLRRAVGGLVEYLGSAFPKHVEAAVLVELQAHDTVSYLAELEGRLGAKDSLIASQAKQLNALRAAKEALAREHATALASRKPPRHLLPQYQPQYQPPPQQQQQQPPPPQLPPQQRQHRSQRPVSASASRARAVADVAQLATPPLALDYAQATGGTGLSSTQSAASGFHKSGANLRPTPASRGGARGAPPRMY